MNLFAYLGFFAITLILGVAVRWIDPAFLEQLARKTGLRAVHGWVLLIVATAWSLLPILAGADATDGAKLWLVGPALSFAGFYLAVFAVTSIDEYRILTRATLAPPEDVTTGDGTHLVATSAIPVVDDDAEAQTPFTGTPAVHTDWILQTRERVLGFGRKTWQNIATDVESIPFTLGNRVHVTGGRHRVFTSTETVVTFSPDEPLPDRAETLLSEREDLVDPDERDSPLRVIETVVRADEPVTVVGTPRLGERPGEVRFDSAPADLLFGSHADQSTPHDEPEVILVQGHADEATALLKKRVYWLGIGSAVLILGGQALGFAFSAARLASLL